MAEGGCYKIRWWRQLGPVVTKLQDFHSLDDALRWCHENENDDWLLNDDWRLDAIICPNGEEIPEHEVRRLLANFRPEVKD